MATVMRWVSSLVFCVLSLHCEPATASSIDRAVENIAEKVAKYLKAEGQKTLFIKTPFETPVSPRGVTGKGVELKLREALTKLDVTLQDENDLISGNVRWVLRGKLAVDPTGKSPITRITINLENANGTEVSELAERVDPTEIVDELDRTEDIPKILTTTAEFQQPVEQEIGKPADAPAPAVTTPEDRQREADRNRKIRDVVAGTLQNAVKSPKFFPVSTTEIKSDPESRFSLKVLVSRSERGPFQPAPIKDANGVAFVDRKEGDFLQVVVSNQNSFDVGLELLMDGVNSLHFAEAESTRTAGKWFIPANSRDVVIDGWFERPGPQGVKKFLITSQLTGVAARIGRKDTIGAIQANFFLAFPEDNTVLPIFVAATGGRGAVGEGPRGGFNGSMVRRSFAKGIPLATIGLIHQNPPEPEIP
ncbi:MAG: hypothetical protein KDA89_23860 [Planctomycetaceae bacterium]|nr:hypothetical protein [Planctomycetaceae bacterium]